MIADRLRAAILQAAISGKLTKQHPEDGTAEELLEQIAAERAALAKAKKLQKQRDLHPVTEGTQPFVLPASWEWVRFQDVNQFRIGKTPKKAEPKYWSPSEIPWVAISDMTQGGSITSTKQGVSAVAIAECYGGQLSPAGTLIMSFKLTIGRCSFLGQDAVHNEAIVSIFPAVSAGDSFSRYLSHALPLLSQLGDSKAAIKGNTLNSESIANLPIPLPPPMEQERIVAKLDEVLPLIDQLAELEREREYLDREFAKAIERAILQAAISGKLTDQRPEDGTATELLETIKTERQQLEKEGKIKKQKPLPLMSEEVDLFDVPHAWAWVRLGQLVKYSGSGSTPKGGKAVYVHEGTMFLRSQNIHNDGLRTQDVAFVSQATVETLGSNTVYPGDLLLNITGASIGRAAVVPSGFAPSKTNQHILTIRLIDPRLARYIQTVITSDFGFRQIMQRQNGGTKEGLNSTSALSLPVPVPPVDEQERIAAKLDRALPLARGLGELVS